MGIVIVFHYIHVPHSRIFLAMDSDYSDYNPFILLMLLVLHWLLIYFIRSPSQFHLATIQR